MKCTRSMGLAGMAPGPNTSWAPPPKTRPRETTGPTPQTPRLCSCDISGLMSTYARVRVSAASIHPPPLSQQAHLQHEGGEREAGQAHHRGLPSLTGAETAATAACFLLWFGRGRVRRLGDGRGVGVARIFPPASPAGAACCSSCLLGTPNPPGPPALHCTRIH